MGISIVLGKFWLPVCFQVMKPHTFSSAFFWSETLQHKHLIIVKSEHRAPVVSIESSGFRPGGSVRERKQMRQNYAESDPWRSLVNVGKCVTLANRCQLPGFFLEVWRRRIMMYCCTHGRPLICLLFAPSWSVVTARMAATYKLSQTCCEMFYGDFIKKSHICFIWGFLMRFWLFSCTLAIIFSSAGFHAKLLKYYFCFSVSLVKKGQIWRAMKRTFSSMLLHFIFLILHRHRLSVVVFVWFSSSGSDLSSTMSVSTVFVPAQRLPVISSLPGQSQDEGACVFRTYADPYVDKLPCCCIGQCCLQPKVIWQLLNGCCWATALQQLFPCLTLWMSKAPAV